MCFVTHSSIAEHPTVERPNGWHRPMIRQCHVHGKAQQRRRALEGFVAWHY